MKEYSAKKMIKLKREQLHITMAQMSREKIFQQNRNKVLTGNDKIIENALREKNYHLLVQNLQVEAEFEFQLDNCTIIQMINQYDKEQILSLLILFAEKSTSFRNYLATNKFCEDQFISKLSLGEMIQFTKLIRILKNQSFFVTNLSELCYPIFMLLNQLNNYLTQQTLNNCQKQFIEQNLFLLESFTVEKDLINEFITAISRILLKLVCLYNDDLKDFSNESVIGLLHKMQIIKNSEDNIQLQLIENLAFNPLVVELQIQAKAIRLLGSFLAQPDDQSTMLIFNKLNQIDKKLLLKLNNPSSEIRKMSAFAFSNLFACESQHLTIFFSSNTIQEFIYLVRTEINLEVLEEASVCVSHLIVQSDFNQFVYLYKLQIFDMISDFLLCKENINIQFNGLKCIQSIINKQNEFDVEIIQKTFEVKNFAHLILKNDLEQDIENLFLKSEGEIKDFACSLLNII